VLISIYALSIQEDLPTVPPGIHQLRTLTADNAEQSKVKIVKFLLNICIKCKIILCSISFTVIFKVVVFANLGDKQGVKQ